MRLKSWIAGLLALMVGMGTTSATLAFDDVETEDDAFEEPAEDTWEPEEEEDEIDPWEEDADDDVDEEPEW